MAGDVPLFREFGFEVRETGEEPLVDLRTATWAGKDFAWVRQQENSCLRSGVTYREICVDLLTPDQHAAIERELAEISTEHLNDTVYGRELGLMVGKLDLREMFRKRLFIAEKEGRIEGFVVSTPSHNGRVWSVETYRRRKDSARGVVTFLIVQMSRQMRSEGVQYLSLCQCPALRCGGESASESRPRPQQHEHLVDDRQLVLRLPAAVPLQEPLPPDVPGVLHRRPPGMPLCPDVYVRAQVGVILPDSSACRGTCSAAVSSGSTPRSWPIRTPRSTSGSSPLSLTGQDDEMEASSRPNRPK